MTSYWIFCVQSGPGPCSASCKITTKAFPGIEMADRGNLLGEESEGALHVIFCGARWSMAIILATGSKVRGFKLRGVDGLFQSVKNPEYDFLWKGSKDMGPMSQIHGT